MARRYPAKVRRADEPLPTSDQKLDEALALTFPASDPPAQTQSIVHVGIKKAERSSSGRR